jgi:uncharacterized membrane protein YdfJ with MMPL/SSD domain
VNEGKIRRRPLGGIEEGHHGVRYDYNDEDIYAIAGFAKQPLKEIAGPDEILEYFTSVMRGEVHGSTLNDRSLAAKELAKRQIDLVEQMRAADTALIVKLDWTRDDIATTTDDTEDNTNDIEAITNDMEGSIDDTIDDTESITNDIEGTTNGTESGIQEV